MLMYLYPLQKWLVNGQGLCILSILAIFVISEMGQFWGFQAFSEEHMVGMVEILHADVSWPPSELTSLWWWSVDFSNFGAILT